VERLARGAHGEKHEIIDLALVLRRHPLVRVECAVAAVTARDLAGDLAGEVFDVEAFDALSAAFAFEQALPRRLDAAAERGDHSHPGNDDTFHSRAPTRRSPPVRNTAARSSLDVM